MATRWICGVGAALLTVSTLVAGPTYAQDCGTRCVNCGWFGHEGTSYQAGAEYNMNCYNDIPYCVACPHQQLVRDQVSDGARIAELLQFASTADLRKAALDFRNRVLISPKRNLVVVQGNGCDRDALATVVFLTPARARALRTLRFRLLDDYVLALRSDTVSAAVN
jgi:hypothetical protein